MPDGCGPVRAPGRAERDRLTVAGAVLSRLRNEAQIFARIGRVVDRAIESRFELGGLLAKLKSKHWFGGYATFSEMAERHFGIRKSTAYAAVTLYEVLTRHAVTWEQVRGIALSKLTLLCARVAAGRMTAEEFSSRLAHAKLMTFRELAAAVAPPRRRRRPVYPLKSRPDRGKEEILQWMQINGAETVLGWFREAFPRWRPQDVIAAYWRATRAPTIVPDNGPGGDGATSCAASAPCSKPAPHGSRILHHRSTT